MISGARVVACISFLLISSGASAAFNGIRDHNLRREIPDADPYMRAILLRHEATFPGAMDHNYLIFYTPLSRISHIQQGLLSELLSNPQYTQLLEGREPLTNMDVTVPQEFSFSTRRSFFGNPWWKTSDRLLDTIRECINGSKSLSVAGLIQWMQTKIFAEKKKSEGAWLDPKNRRLIQAWVLAASLAKRNSGLSLSDLKELIDDSSSGILDYMHDPLNYTPLVMAMPNSGRRTRAWKQELLSLMPGLHGELSGGREEETKVRVSPGAEIHIREVHPEIAILRGYVGNDCSTSFSPGFVFDPYDRYFYVFDENQKRLGYVGLTLVLSGKKPAVLIHTIQGPDFTAAQTQLVMRAFAKTAFEVYGASGVYLSSDDSIGANVNFSPISTTMMDAVSNQEHAPMTFLDHEYRSTIASWDSTLTYDNPERNSRGRKLEFPADSVAVVITESDFSRDFLPRIPQEKRSSSRSCSGWLIDREGVDWD